MPVEVIGRYHIQGVIGEGGMATVYRALDPAIGRLVALKWMSDELSDRPGFVARFEREARIVAQLVDTHIVPIYDMGRHEGRPYLVMRLLSGGTLEERLARKMELPAVIQLVRELGQALEVAHRKGIVHRDIKPQNILFDERNRAVLTDFGIAKVLDASVQLTTTGRLMGTPYYMSPEQFQVGDIDEQSDQYSLAVVLFQVLSGQLPFRGNWKQLAGQHLSAPPPDICQVDQSLPPAIAPVLQRAMAKNPDHRYPDIMAFTQAVQDALLSPPPPIPVNNGKTDTDKRVVSRSLWSVLGVVVLLALLAGGAMAMQIKNGRESAATATASAIAAATATDATDAAAPTLATTITSIITPTTTTPATMTVTATPAEPTATSSPTATATATTTATATASTPTATHTPRPTSTPTPTVTAAPNVSVNDPDVFQGGRLPNFETSGNWVRGDEPNGTLQQSSEQAYAGGFSGKLSYDFPGPENDYIVFLQTYNLPGTPDTISLWVYGDGAGHRLNVWILDADGQTWQVPLGAVSHTGWKQMSGRIDVNQDWPWTHISGPDNEAVDYPISFRAIVLDDVSNDYQGQGVIYIDELTASFVGSTDQTGPQPGGGAPTLTPTLTPALTTTPAGNPPDRGTYTPTPTLPPLPSPSPTPSPYP